MPVHARHRRPLALAAGGACALVGAATEPLTSAAAVAVAVPAVVVLVLAAREPRPRPERAGPSVPASRRRTARAWAAVVALLAAAETVALARQPTLTTASTDSPTLSLLLDPVTEPWPFRLVAWCCWLALGWALVSR